MVAALTSAEIRAAFAHWKVPADYEPGWERRSNGNPWGDVTMLVMHHTGDDMSDAASGRVLRDGYSGLRGPLAQFAPKDTGRLLVIAAGPANHAGSGDPKVLAAVRAESYRDYPPKTTKGYKEPGSVGGNSISYGWESMYAGRNDPTINPLQYRVAVLSQAAITWALDKKDTKNVWTSKSTIGHKEWQEGKPDPAGIDMKVQRADIQWCLDNGPVAAFRWYLTGSRTAPTPTPIPEAQEHAMFVYQISDHEDPNVANAKIISDGFRMRWVSYIGWVRLNGAYKYQHGEDLYVTKVKDLDGVAVEWVGPLPTPDFPIPASVRVISGPGL